MKTITLTEVKAMVAAKQVVFAYPRKGYICVNGGTYFKADGKTIIFVKGLGK